MSPPGSKQCTQDLTPGNVRFRFNQGCIVESKTSRCPGLRIVLAMKLTWLCMLVLIPLAACTPEKRSPDAIREDTARATSEATRDAKAVAQGVVEGLKQKGPVNINKASDKDLETLPGIDVVAAKRIIDGRPYDNG